MDDPLNRTIWNESPGRQMKIFPPCAPKVGMVAAAQAFVEPPPLPWVPDLVGRNWQKRGSVLVMGIGYADFFYRPTRPHRMHLRDYREAKEPASFQAAFLERVVRGDTAYYEKIADLLENAGVALECTVITDIRRASFGCWDGTRITAGTGVLRNYDTAFRPYVHQNQDWHNSRLDKGGFRVIVTLGGAATSEVKTWLRGRGWRERGPSIFTSPAGRVVNILAAPHPNAWGNAWGKRLADVAERLRKLRGGDTPPIATPKPDVPRPTCPPIDDATPRYSWNPQDGDVLVKRACSPRHRERARQLHEKIMDGMTVGQFIASNGSWSRAYLQQLQSAASIDYVRGPSPVTIAKPVT
jgi:hypothetical protein